MRIIPPAFTLALMSMSFLSTLAIAQTDPPKTGDESATKKSPAPSNWQLKTLGGMQFWTDVKHSNGWRIQQNSETGHFRLIDPNAVRFAFGSRQQCDAAFSEIALEEKIRPLKGRIVILLHGLMRTNASMAPLGEHLRKNGGFEIVNFQYASTRKRVEDHAKALSQVIDNLGSEVTEINFVGHSLGNIVVRRYLGDQATTDQPVDQRIKRMVMLGPPNQGSRMARLLKSSLSFKVIAGASGAELSNSWRQLEPTLATPEFEFAIIAGGQTDKSKLNNVLLTGKDDFTVSVEETKLIGANDFQVRPLIHTTMMKDKRVFQDTLRFFENGYFRSESTRNPLTSLN
ncbi:alpha/beta hydrolase [Mariniblastus sp.]|nr:alpha/beta hydrolase [Mariniblastus sp.]MDC3224658.1 alpha/beta hydrolase [Mariniblastus sp.]